MQFERSRTNILWLKQIIGKRKKNKEEKLSSIKLIKLLYGKTYNRKLDFYHLLLLKELANK